MNGKTIAIVSYLNLIGWIIAIYFQSKAVVKENIASFHLRQSLGIMLTAFVGGIAFSLVGIDFLTKVFLMMILILWIIGLVSAIQGTEKPIPIIGDYFQDWFKTVN
jgi:uncharacterized membrane protein